MHDKVSLAQASKFTNDSCTEALVGFDAVTVTVSIKGVDVSVEVPSRAAVKPDTQEIAPRYWT